MSIELILGCMFASKTSMLLQQYKHYKIKNKKCLLVKYSEDTRYSSTGIATHDMQIYECDVVSTKKLGDINTDIINNVEVILIDEGQFYSDIVEFSEQFANMGKIIIISALDGTFEREPFGHVLELIPKAEKVHKYRAICEKCHKKASFTKRITTDSEVELIGGADCYQSMCRQCYFQ